MNRFGPLALAIVTFLPRAGLAEDRLAFRLETTDGQEFRGAWVDREPFRVESNLGRYQVGPAKIEAVQLEQVGYFPGGGRRYVGTIKTVTGLTIKGDIDFPPVSFAFAADGSAGEIGSLTIADPTKIKSLSFALDSGPSAERPEDVPPPPPVPMP